MFDEKMINQIAFALVLAGALNWGSVALAKTNAVEALLGKEYAVYVYYLVAASAVYLLAKQYM